MPPTDRQSAPPPTEPDIVVPSGPTSSGRSTAVPPTQPSTPEQRELSNDELFALGRQHILGNYRQGEPVFVRGRGSWVYDKNGKGYIDCAAGVAVCALGHGHPRLTAAIAEQAGQLMHISNYFYNDQNVLLARELCKLSGLDKAFFCNSGAEANEAMIKGARRHFFAQGKTEKFRLIAFDNAFHGRTLATVNLTGTPAYREGFGPKFEGITHVPYGDIEAVRKAMGPDVCGIVVETVQGEGGVLPAPKGFLEGLRELCDAHDALLLFDEVQTGIGRTGRWFGGDHVAVKADAISLAKGLGGGFPIGATLFSAKLASALPPGTHGSTFGGNALASRAALTVLSVLRDERVVEGVAARGALLRSLLQELAKKHPDLCEGERGLGLLRGLVLKAGVDTRSILGKARDRGLLLTVAGGVVLRFTPPLIISEEELRQAVKLLDETLQAVRLELVTG